ncbi:hypothetical protein WJX72_012289 [[Myrmecia] bisecta]|uniref:RBR-type E3 ubiquitin transferase n=1 Tax=[Myrmecia] bisecta TaxID=41462 RepID=A0AAW1Q6M4_9CHLO
MVELTEAEAAVYDRQLRVWGVETQKRLNAARILILGCTGLAAEVAKNIVLAGVGSLTLMDDSPCSTCPPGNFLVPADATPTQSVAEVSVQTLQEMNPLVKVEARKGSIASLQDRSLVKDYNVVLLIGPPSRLAQQLDEECSKHGVAFYVAASRGTTSYMFADLHTHTYGPMNVKEGQPVTTSTVQFTPLAKALFAPWRSLPPPIKRKHKLFFVLRVCAEFERKHRRFPSAKDLCLGVQPDWAAPARLDFVYEDDDANLPLHYIAFGTPAGLLSRWRLLAPFYGGRPSTHSKERAALLHWLLHTGFLADLGLVNRRLETPLHCALRSHSIHVTQVLLTAPGVTIALATSPDIQGTTPLDIALDTRQWRAVRLLIAAGALEKCRQMDQMRQLLADMLPNALLGRARLPGLLPSGLQSVLGLVFRQPNSRSTLDGPASEPGTAAGPAQHAGSAAQQPGSLVICLADSVEDVLLHKQKLLQHVANMTGRDVPSAGAVLASNRWDERQAIAACQVDAALKARLPCGHTTCNTCWKGILRARLGDGDVQHTICPDPDCSMPLPDSAVVQLLSRADLQRFRRLMAQNYVDSNPCIKWCPRPNCGKAVALQVVPGHPDGVADAVANGRALDVACACGHRFCFSCLAAPHEPAHCDWALSWEALVAQSRAEAANQNQHWMHRHTKKCPGCGSNIQKTGGCNHMVCTLCRRQFCWVCGGDWSQHNAETGGYYACNRFSQPGEEDFAAEDGNPAQEHGGPRGFLEGLLQGVTQRAVQFRIGHHMRRYFAQDCDERQLLVAAQWMAALLTASMPEPAMGRGIATDQTAAEERYVYLTRLAEEVVRTRQVLQNSYIAAYYLGYGDQRRQFEEMQGRLETAVEHLALPLVLLPDAATIVAEAAMRPGSELAASLDKLPLPVSDRDTLKRQFFFAAAVEQRSHAIKRLLAGMVGDRERMLQLGRTGKLWNAEAGGSGGPQRAQQRGQPPDQAQLGYGSSLANVAAALASFWADRG